MKKRVGCVFMSMLLFFGIAVMGVDAAGKKQDFTPKTITVKKSYTSSTEKYLNEKKTYRIIKSYDELKQFQKKTQKAYVKANGKQAKAKFEKSAFNKKLNRYKSLILNPRHFVLSRIHRAAVLKKSNPGKDKIKAERKGKDLFAIRSTGKISWKECEHDNRYALLSVFCGSECKRCKANTEL